MRILVFLPFFLCFSVFSQEKFEREYRANKNEIPTKAKEFIAKCLFTKKVKWYVEESQDGKTIEAKSCKNNYKFSIEFTTDGNVLDVEKKVKWKEVELSHQQKITETLKKEFKKFRFKKIQLQCSSSENECLNFIKNDLKNDSFLYEIVLKGKKEDSFNMYEILINAEGKILKELKFTPQNTDNLEF